MLDVHQSVLMKEVIEGLSLNPSDVVVDATINGGGHAQLITQKLSDTGVFIGIDIDADAIEASTQKLKDTSCQLTLVNDNFSNLDTIIATLELAHVDKVLFDLGWSSNQFENPERGFSFNHDGPLLMTLSTNPETSTFTAYDIVNTWEESHIADILKGYGDERYASSIALAIVKRREDQAIVSTRDLAELISSSVPRGYRKGKIHPATKSFQALRIAVNNELEVLREGLRKAFEALGPKGRIVVISFHSIEDRVVKNYFRSLKDEQKARIITKKPITATEEELKENRRSRSAKLRIIEKI